MNYRSLSVLGLTLVTVVAAGCATGRAYVKGQNAAKAGDWDAAVAYYREALSHDAGRVDVRLALERATRTASQNHMARARQLEQQDQLPGASAEYRQAADLDASNALAAAKVIEIDRLIRQRIEDARPKSQMQELREQARKVSAVPQLSVDPRVPLPALNFNQTAVRDVIAAIAAFAGINVTYDSASQPENNLSKPYTANLTGVTLQDALNQVLGGNMLFYKVVDSKTILIATDNPSNRGRLEDQVVQIFYLSHADANELMTVIQTIMNQLNTLGVKPVITPNKASNSIMVRTTVPVMAVIERLIHSSDKPRAEVVIDVEILEVSRSTSAQMGLNLSNYQLGMTFSPETAPAATGGGTFPVPPGPFNLNTVSQGVSMADFYLTVPSAVVKALENDTRTKVLARTSLRGSEGKPLTLNLGEQIPVPSTTFSPLAAGGVANQPTTSFTLKDVGINLTMTPIVTYDNEIRIELAVDNSAKAADVSVAGQNLPSFSQRKATTVLRLRDGESNLLAGLLKEADSKAITGLPGISKIPWLRALFGFTDKSNSSSDMVMLITPRIVRGHELTVEDLSPIYVGTSQNFGLTGPPALIATPPTAEELAAAGVTGSQAAAPPSQAVGTPPAMQAQPAQTAPAQTQAPARNPVVVPVTPVNQNTQQNPPATQPPAPTVPAGQPAAPAAARPAMVALQVPAQMQAGGGPYTMPLQVTDVQNVSSVRVTITYNPAVLKASTVTEGAFLRNGGVQTTFTPRIDEAAGRIEVMVTRPAGASGVSGAGLLGAIVFQAVSAGQAGVSMTVTALSPTGQNVAVQAAPVSVVVR